jgi:hypothetical protein
VGGECQLSCFRELFGTGVGRRVWLRCRPVAQILRWESPALRATPLPQDDRERRGCGAFSGGGDGLAASFAFGFPAGSVGLPAGMFGLAEFGWIGLCLVLILGA